MRSAEAERLILLESWNYNECCSQPGRGPCFVFLSQCLAFAVSISTVKCTGQQSKRNCQEKSISTPLLEILRGRVIFESESIKGEKEQVQTKKFSLGGECLDCNLSNMLFPNQRPIQREQQFSQNHFILLKPELSCKWYNETYSVKEIGILCQFSLCTCMLT